MLNTWQYSQQNLEITLETRCRHTERLTQLPQTTWKNGNSSQFMVIYIQKFAIIDSNKDISWLLILHTSEY